MGKRKVKKKAGQGAHSTKAKAEAAKAAMESKSEEAAAAHALVLKGADEDDEEIQQQDENDDDSRPPDPTEEQIISGRLDYLPPRPSDVVRIYLASTFTDFTVEKSLIMRHAVPELRTYARKHGLEFQLVDLSWAAREDLCTDHTALNIAMEEIKLSKKMSRGPFFVALIGDKYGPRPYPSLIEAEEFQILYDAGKAEGADVLLLDDWYIRDDNPQVAQFVLQPVTARFPFFNDEAEGNRNRKKKDQDDWAAINTTLLKLFRSAATRAHKEEKITAEQKHRYFRSEMETEFSYILDTFKKSRQGVLCFMRSFTDIVPSDRMARRFVDIENNSLNENTQELLNSFKDKITETIGKENVTKFTIPWLAQGVVQSDNEHMEYLTAFVESFKNEIIRQIDDCVRGPTVRDNLSPLGREILSHLWIHREKRGEIIFHRKGPVAQVRRFMFKTYSDKVEQKQEENEDTEESGEPKDQEENEEKEKGDDTSLTTNENDMLGTDTEESSSDEDNDDAIVAVEALNTNRKSMDQEGQDGGESVVGQNRSDQENGDEGTPDDLNTNDRDSDTGVSKDDNAESMKHNSENNVTIDSETKDERRISKEETKDERRISQTETEQERRTSKEETKGERRTSKEKRGENQTSATESSTGDTGNLDDSKENKQSNALVGGSSGEKVQNGEASPNKQSESSELEVKETGDNDAETNETADDAMKSTDEMTGAESKQGGATESQGHDGETDTPVGDRVAGNGSEKEEGTNADVLEKIGLKDRLNAAEADCDSDEEFSLDIVRTKDVWECAVQRAEVTSIHTPRRDEVTLSQALVREIKMKRLENYGRPVIIYGEPGDGKTSVLTQVACDIEDWFEKPIVKIMRYLGETRNTMCIREALIGVCEHIWKVYDVNLNTKIDIREDYTKLAAYFNILLHKIPSEDKPLVILLDSVEKLLNRDDAFNMDWLPLKLPPCVHIIVTVGLEKGECMLNLVKVLPFEIDCYVEVDKDIQTPAVQEALENWTQQSGRTIDHDQTSMVISQMKGFKCPLLLKLALEHARFWKSYTTKSDMVLMDSDKETMEKVVNDLLKSFSKVVVPQISGYILCSRYGVTEQEMEDLLSADDEVLKDTYLYYLPQDELVLRMPPLTWQRLYHELKAYLRTYTRGRRRLISFHHPSYADPAFTKLLTPDAEKEFHHSFSEYFLGKPYGTVQPFDLGRKKSAFSQCTRHQPPQPLSFGNSNLNLRKLEELPYHLIQCQRYTDFVTQCCRSFDWIYKKCKSKTLHDFLDELTFALKRLPAAMLKLGDEDNEGREVLEAAAEEIQLLHSVMAPITEVVERAHSALAIQLLATLMNRITDSLPVGLQQLRQQALLWCQNVNFPLLVPQNQCLPFPGLELQCVHRVHLYKKGGRYLEEKKLCLSEDGNTLYVVDQQPFGNYLLQYNLEQGGRLTNITHLRRRHVRKMSLAARDAYLLFELYDKENELRKPCFHYRLLERNSMKVPRDIPTDVEVFAVSSTGRYFALRYPMDPGLPTRPIMTLLDTRNGNKTALFGQRWMDVKLALFSQDETYCVLLTSNGAYSYSVETGRQRHRWEENRKGESFLQNTTDAMRRCMHVLNSNQLLTRGFDGPGSRVIHRRDLRTGEIMYEMKGHLHPIDIITLNFDHTLAIAASTSTIPKPNDHKKVAYVWDLEWGKLLARCGRGAGSKAGSVFSSMAFCGPEDEYILTNCLDGEPSITLWYIGRRSDPIVTGIPLHELVVHNKPVIYMQVGNRGDTLISAALDNTIALWDLRKIYKRCERMMEGHLKNAKTVDAFRTVCYKEAEQPYKPGEGMMVATSMTTSRDGTLGVVGTRDGWVLFFDMTTLAVKKYERVAMRKPVNLMLTSKSGRFIITAATTIRVWSPQAESKYVFTVACRDRVDSLAENYDVLVAGFSGRECCGMVWDLPTGLRLRRLEGYYGFSYVAISSDATRVVGVFFDFPMIFNVKSGEPMNSAQMETAEYNCTCLAMSPDDQHVVCGSTDGSVKLMDSKSGAYRIRLQHQSPVKEVTFTPDSKHLLTAGFRTIFIWCTNEGNLLHTLDQHEAPIERIRFAVKGRFLITCARDQRIILWDYKERKFLADFRAHCPVEVIAVPEDLSNILYAPENIDYLGVLRPNPHIMEMKGDTNYVFEEMPLFRIPDDDDDANPWG